MRLIGRMKDDLNTRPATMAVIVVLVALGGMVFPTDFLTGMDRLNALALVRYIFAAAGVVFVLMLGLHGGLTVNGKRLLSGLDVFLVLLVLVVNNFPLIPLYTGAFKITADTARVWSYLNFCLSVGVFEEIFFRALLYPIIKEVLRHRRNRILPAVLVSSAAFGLVHLVNLVGGDSIGSVMMQIGYSALFGAGYAFLYELTGSVWPAVVLHTVFDIGGLLGEIGDGAYWTSVTVALTAVLGVLTAGYVLYRFVRHLKRVYAVPPPVTAAEQEKTNDMHE